MIVLPFFPIFLVDMLGSSLMILLSFMCLNQALKLKKRDVDNVIWSYLVWVCGGLAAFAISRSVGHILKNYLAITGKVSVWEKVSPFSGGINTIMFVLVGSITLFFGRIWGIYQKILEDKRMLLKTEEELRFTNLNLEDLVEERTRELTRTEKKYRRIFELSKDIIIATRSDGEILDINPVGRELLGEDSGSFKRGRFLSEYLYDPSDWDRILSWISENGVVLNEEITLKKKNREPLLSLVSAVVDRSVPEEEEALHFLIKDIERRRQIEQQMAQADKLASIGELSAGIAHEINNPLGIILGYTQLMMREQENNKEVCQDLKTIEKHVKHCKTIVEDLLDFSRSSKAVKEDCRIEDIIDSVVSFVDQHIEPDNVRIYTEYSMTPLVNIDKKKMKQVFINLLMNAIHAVEKDGEILIKTGFDKGNGLVFASVSDDGYGIKDVDMPKIFDPFFTTKPTGQGTGLGLSVSYGIVRSHGGTIDVKSKASCGSTFTVRLPAVGEKADARH